MTNRKNLKISPDVYDQLTDEKESYETWDGMMLRLLEQSD
jgi:predicted CopG family antitoxin